MPPTPRDQLRRLIRSADTRIAESVKWNAPSFSISSHFVTLSAKPELLHAVLHTDAKPLARPKAIKIDDPAGLLTWPAKDRALVKFDDAADLKRRGEAFVAILQQWIAQTQGAATRAVQKAVKPSEREHAAQIAAYIAALAPAVRREVKKLRTAVRAAAPDAVEHFSYGIPGLRLDGKALVYYAGWKAHISLYPIGESIVKANAKALAGCTFSKGTVRFPLDAPPSAALVAKLVRARIAQVRAGKAVG